MTDLNPEIWDNPTLGDAATNGFADEKALQEVENAAAMREGREPWIAQRLHRYPGSHNDVSVESSYDDGMRLIDPATLAEFDSGVDTLAGYNEIPEDDEDEVVNDN